MSHAYGQSARLYDRFSAHKDYRQASKTLRGLVRDLNPGARTLLDVACGSGGHLQHLRGDFDAQGLDLSPEMLALAAEKCPGLLLHQGDLVGFSLDRRFDVVTCLFGSVGYAGTPERLSQAVANMAHHLEPGGLLILEPWLTPERYEVGRLTADFIDETDLKAARVYRHDLEGGCSVFDIAHVVASDGGIETFTERHALGLFTAEQYRAALRDAGLELVREDAELFGYGSYCGVRAA